MTDLQKRVSLIKEKLAYALLIDGCNELTEDELNGLCHGLKSVYDDVVELEANLHPAVVHPAAFAVVQSLNKRNGNGARVAAPARPAA